MREGKEKTRNRVKEKKTVMKGRELMGEGGKYRNTGERGKRREAKRDRKIQPSKTKEFELSALIWRS